jgi:peptidoglycan/xylan/chitin deacetylase (PgdA/CDA1 family)
MYHEISDNVVSGDWEQMTTPKALFAAQMRWLQEAGYRVIKSEEALNLLLGRRMWPQEPLAVLTFDDGLRSYLTNAWPVLEPLGFPNTLFVATGLMGQDREHLTWEEVRHLMRSGLVTCGSHTVSHTKLRGLHAARVRSEIRESKRALEESLQHGVNLFAYPYGSYDTFDDATIDALKAEGFGGAFTTIAGTNRPGTEVFRLRRTRISWVDQLPEFQITMAGALDWYAGYQWITSRGR